MNLVAEAAAPGETESFPGLADRGVDRRRELQVESKA